MNDINTIDGVGDDIAGRMLSALTRDEPRAAADEGMAAIPIADQKKYLITNIHLLSVADRKDIGDIMIMNNRRNAIRECSEGSVINLDVQPEHVVTQMYDLMAYKLAKRR